MHCCIVVSLEETHDNYQLNNKNVVQLSALSNLDEIHFLTIVYIDTLN